jgi:hypothetical protein
LPWPDSLPCPHKSSDTSKHVSESRTQPQPDRKPATELIPLTEIGA